ncbi:50S ribosomal protein L6 [Candidatus Woesearchaeota archaeon]|nr:50S ribosomal protein L6 [Candidatus Woesearchaeota archaeon]|tara:strand:+ start:10470 stop:11021 length:552 start_codon:yes stop_codon:yes gene_type:complete
MRPENIEEKIEIPKGINAALDRNTLILKADKGELKRKLLSKTVNFSIESNAVKLAANKPSKREKKIIGTFKVHIKNMIKGLTEGHVYKLKVCSSHFPMTVSVSNNEFIIKNFFGETSPRKLKITEGVEVKVEGEIITVNSINKEHAAQTAGSIENLTRRVNFDRRVYMDGIYITEKDGKEIKL